MKHPHQQPALERECSEVLQQWEDWSEIPMLVLSFAWLGLFIVELVWGLTPILEAIGTTIFKHCRQKLTDCELIFKH